MNLYELTEQYQSILELAYEGAEGVDYTDMLQGMEGVISDKLEGYCKVIKTLEVEAEAIKAEAVRLSQRKTALENQVTRMKEAMKINMIRLNLDKHKGQLFTVSLTKPRQRVEVTNIDAVPSELIKVKKEVDKTAAMEALKAGEKLHGLELVYGESGLSIR
ncbi:siphovirus Gp157 family protein [Neobacillus mesonae]|nr:siphovirus Gp157 family protein [Neobacillus mesonae]